MRVLTAVDRTHTLLRYSAASYAALLPAFIIDLHWGVVSVASCYAIVNVPPAMASSSYGVPREFLEQLARLIPADVIVGYHEVEVGPPGDRRLLVD